MESLQTSQGFQKKYCWVFAQSKYDNLRKAKGFEDFQDIPEVTTSEKDSVLVTAQKLGVAEEDITVFSDLDDYYNIEFQLKQSLK